MTGTPVAKLIGDGNDHFCKLPGLPATVSSEPPLVARRVLIIEPHPDDAATLQGWVEATGRFDVTVVPYLPPTDDLLLAEDWGLIVVDLHEPTIEDVELVRRARATRGWTPVLLIVARDRDDQLSRALRASVDDAWRSTREFFLKRDPAQVERLVKTTVDKWGRLDCAFNNAGIFPDDDGGVLE